MAVMSVQIVDPDRLSARARSSLAEQLYAVHEQVFEHPGREVFARTVLWAPAAERTRVGVHLHQGRVAGYSATHIYRMDVRGVPSLVMRGESGLLPEARGGATMGWLWARELARALASLRPVFYFGCHVHPSAYVALSRRLPGLEPTPRSPGDGLDDELADAFGLERHPAHPHLRNVGWVAREVVRSSTCKLARFYAEKNPLAGDGYGLPVAARVTPGSLARAYGRHLTRCRATR